MDGEQATFQVTEMPARQLACMRHTGPYKGDFQLFDRLFRRVSSWMKAQNLFGPGMEVISVYQGDPCP